MSTSHSNGGKTSSDFEPPPPPSLPYSVPQDDISKELASVWGGVSKSDESLKRLEDGDVNTQNHHKNAPTVRTSREIPDETRGMQAVNRDLGGIWDGGKVLMSALDEVAKLHPFIGVVVLAFKAVWALEMKRKQNDKKILMVFIEMKDMMTVLLQLKNVKDLEVVASDGGTLRGRMEELVKGAAKDITDCANACDAYSRQNVVVKVLKGPVWESRLLKFVELFTKRRSEFEFALTIYTLDIDKTTQELNAKMDLFMKMFQSIEQPDEKEMAQLIDEKGGSKVIQENREILGELHNLEQAKTLARDKSSELDDLMGDLHVDLDVALENNKRVFSRKFDVQRRMIVEELSQVVHREGDRIIMAITSEPYEKIIDPDVHSLWKEMKWRDSVKAHDFVISLRDYFQKKWVSDGPRPIGATAIAPRGGRSDEWVLAHLNIESLQFVSDAWDDDTSGLVTVGEVNTFTTSRPLEWSLPHWIAYWAIGWHQSMTVYKTKIEEIIAKMFAILPHILPVNRASVNDYISQNYRDMATVQASLNVCYMKDSLQARFKSYVDAEQARLIGNLEAVVYQINSIDTLTLITGHGRFERFALPLIYLLLRRHFEIMRICRERVIHPDELSDASNTMRTLLYTVDERVDALRAIFKQQKVDPEQRFKTFAHGLFEYPNQPLLLWEDATIKAAEYSEYTYDDSLENQEVKAEDILNYSVDQEELDLAAYESPTPVVPAEFVHDQPSLAFDALLGPWNGFIYRNSEEKVAYAGMISMTLCPSTAHGHNPRFEASGRSDVSDFSIVGECSMGKTSNILLLAFKRIFTAGFGATQYYYGEFDAPTQTLTGSWGLDDERRNQDGIFIFKRTAAEDLCFRPAPTIFKADKACALWSFALSVTLYRVRRQLFSWSFFKKRRDDRQRFIEWYIRESRFGCPLDTDEATEFVRLRQALTSADNRFYHSLAEYRIRRTTRHGEFCDNCKGTIGGARIICLDCDMKDHYNTVDLCEAPNCVAARVDRLDLKKPHVPTHDLMKVRRVVHTNQFGKLYREARQALQAARAAFECEAAQKLATDDGDDLSSNGTQNPAYTYVDVGAGLVCHVCSNRVTQPCWYCVQCPGETFICNNCDAEAALSIIRAASESFENHDAAKATASFDKHDDAHTLVRCTKPVEDVQIPIESRVANLEEQFAIHQKTIDEKLSQLESKVDGVDNRLSEVDSRLRRMEGLLASILENLGGATKVTRSP